MPDLSAKPKTSKPPKKVLVEKETLSRVNRTVICPYCESEKILNPDQYQILFDYHGTEQAVLDEFMCKACEMDMKRNPIKFWAIYGEPLQILSKNLKSAFDQYKNSSRGEPDAVNMQVSCSAFLKEFKIVEPNFEFIIVDRLPIAMKIRHFPCIGNIILRVYEQRKNRIYVEQ